MAGIPPTSCGKAYICSFLTISRGNIIKRFVQYKRMNAENDHLNKKCSAIWHSTVTTVDDLLCFKWITCVDVFDSSTRHHVGFLLATRLVLPLHWCLRN